MVVDMKPEDLMRECVFCKALTGVLVEAIGPCCTACEMRESGMK